MNVYKSRSCVCGVIFLLALSSGICVAGPINSSQLMPAATSPDVLDLEALGIDPASFLFTQNTMYDFNGEYDLSIVSALVDPSDTSSLDGVPMQITNIVLGTSLGTPDDSADTSGRIAPVTDISAAPEPASLLLSTLALGCFLLFVRGKFGQCVAKPDELIDR